jgi:hypothetical protein
MMAGHSFLQTIQRYIESKVKIFTLARNAGTSVDQIERFYAKYLPLSAEMEWKLQSYGE